MSESVVPLWSARAPSLAVLLETAAREVPDQAWLEFVGGETFTFGEVWCRAVAFACGLRDAGVKKGDRVNLFLENSPEFLIAWFAARIIGAVAVPMNTAAKGASLEHYLALTRPALVISSGDLVIRLGRALDAIDLTATLVVVGATEMPTTGAPRSFESMLREGDCTINVAQPTDPAAILFTSGTTGVSKGVTFSERFLVNFAGLACDALGFREDDVLYTCLPFFHANALIMFTCGSLLVRARIAIAQRFSVRGFWPDLARCEATVTSLIGSMAALLFQGQPSELERNHRLRRIMVVPTTADMYVTVCERLGVPPIDMYGMTDVGIFISNRWGAELRPGSCGRAVPGYECRVVNEFDDPLPAGVVGELVVRPQHPALMSEGYWNMPDKTVEAFRGLWFHTGDLVRQDIDGWFYFVDRKKDAIRRRGENISAFEVEEAFLAHPAISEVAAYPLKSELTEDDVALAVVLRPGADASAEELVAFAEERLPYFALPRYVTFVDELPKTPTKKVQKQILIDRGVEVTTWDMDAVGYRPQR